MPVTYPQVLMQQPKCAANLCRSGTAPHPGVYLLTSARGPTREPAVTHTFKALQLSARCKPDPGQTELSAQGPDHPTQRSFPVSPSLAHLLLPHSTCILKQGTHPEKQATLDLPWTCWITPVPLLTLTDGCVWLGHLVLPWLPTASSTRFTPQTNSAHLPVAQLKVCAYKENSGHIEVYLINNKPFILFRETARGNVPFSRSNPWEVQQSQRLSQRGPRGRGSPFILNSERNGAWGNTASRRGFTLLSVHIKIRLLFERHKRRVEIWGKKYRPGCKSPVTKTGVLNLVAKAQSVNTDFHDVWGRLDTRFYSNVK